MTKLTTEDLLAIHQLEAQFGHVIDDVHRDCNWERLYDVLTEDATYDYSQVGGEPLCGVAAMISHWDAHPEMFPLSHHITNVVITEDDDGTVRVRSKVLAPLSEGLPRTSVYDDLVVRTEAGWRIAYRNATQLTPEGIRQGSKPRA